jgi:hypothetical protein
MVAASMPSRPTISSMKANTASHGPTVFSSGTLESRLRISPAIALPCLSMCQVQETTRIPASSASQASATGLIPPMRNSTRPSTAEISKAAKMPALAALTKCWRPAL